MKLFAVAIQARWAMMLFQLPDVWGQDPAPNKAVNKWKEPMTTARHVSETAFINITYRCLIVVEYLVVEMSLRLIAGPVIRWNNLRKWLESERPYWFMPLTVTMLRKLYRRLR